MNGATTAIAHLALEILAHKLKGVEQCMYGSQLNVDGRLILASTVYDGRQNFVGAQAENLRFLNGLS